MARLTLGGIFEATIDRISHSGNAVIEGDSDDTYALLRSGSWEEGDTVTVKITTKNDNSYVAVPMYKEAGAKAPPLHHDGKSAGQTRSMNDAFDSIEDREFDPKTHGAPEVQSTSSGTTPRKNVDSASDSDSEKSLHEIARNLDQPVSTEEQDRK